MENNLDEEVGQNEEDKFIENTVSDKDKTSRSINRSRSKDLAIIPRQKNWKGIFLSIVVIGIVCVIIGVSAWLLQPPESSQDYKYIYDFDAMFDMEWRLYSTNGQWAKESLFYRDRCQNVVKRTGEEIQILITNETMEHLGIYEVTVSPDWKYALLAYDVEKVFRHSMTAQYYVFTIATGSHVKLHSGRLQYAAWGTQRDQLTYILDSDLYYKSSVQAPPNRITNSGKDSDGNIISGIADWIYEEEMFSGTIAHWISNSGSYLAYVTFNDSLVHDVDILLYNTPYPEVEKIKYPKAGYTNPTVELYVYDLRSYKKLRILPPRLLKFKEPLLNSFMWISDSAFLVTWSNRYQNVSIVTFCSISGDSEFRNQTLPCKDVHQQYADGWIEHIGRPPVRGPRGSFFQIEEKPLGAKGKYHHLLMVEFTSDPPTTRFLTSGEWEVTKILGYDHLLDRVYFLSTKTSPMDRHLFSVVVSEHRPKPICHTCETSCRYVQPKLSASASRALLNCKGPGVPYDSLLDLRKQDHTVIEGNAKLKERIRNTKMPKVVLETITINGERGTYDFQAKLYLPINAQLKDNLPLLIYIYAGPGSQKVDSRFSLDWTTYLTTNKEIAVMTFDGRGSGYRGSNAMKEVNRRLGKFEIEDHIIATKEITKKYSFLSKTKIGVWGWSYGGYASAMLATHPWSLAENLIKCVISVAPVTEWRFYDTIYTERYMGSPLNNYTHYQESSLLPRASYFNFFKFLLVHGTRDDNVHFQNSAVLETELVKAGVVHRYQVYTDEKHSLASEPKWTQRHLYKLMTQFLMDCYQAT